MDEVINNLLDRRLLETIWRRRTHRVSQGVGLLKAGSMTYQSTQKPHPLNGTRGGGTDRDDRSHRAHDARPAVPGSQHRHFHHGQAEFDHDGTERRQP